MAFLSVKLVCTRVNKYVSCKMPYGWEYGFYKVSYKYLPKETKVTLYKL